MLVSHLFLAMAWIVYCVLHSVLASITVKQVLEKRIKSAFRFYRFIYTLFAFFGLVAILFYQFTIYSVLLFSSPYWIQIIGGLLMAFGAVLMLMMIWKYFMQLSGVRWLYSEKVSSKLEITGLHKYVRHPLYLGTFAFIWGWFLISPFTSYLIATLIITVYTLIGLKFEEQKLIAEFGDAYVEYKKQVPLLLPDLRKKNQDTRNKIPARTTD
jgi:protein-S-isoprenylcysteine O-methyltransferase Ste14